MKTLLILLFVLIPTIASAWTYKTPAGIVVSANNKTITQYEEHWGLSWDDIDWARIDDTFYALQEYYGGKALRIEPKQLRVNIAPFADCSACAPGLESKTRYGCLEGGYIYSRRTAFFHLGDDSGQGENSFCATAMPHELMHFFLFMMNSECKWDNPGCGEYYPSMQLLGIYK